MSLFLVGSGPTDTLDDVYDEFVRQARAFGGRIAIAILGEPDDVQQYVASHTQPIMTRWPEAEVAMVYLDDEGDTSWPEDFERLAGLVVAGGWTPGYLDALTPQRDAISRLVRGGVPYLGFSAGAMVVSRHAIVGGYRHQGRQVAPESVSEGLEDVTVRDGLALIGPTVETHTDAWSNLGVALAALEASEARTAVTIDEGTTLVIEPASGRTRVLGPGRVHWLQQEGVHVVVSHEAGAAPASEAKDTVAPPSEGAPVKPSSMPRHTPEARPEPAPGGEPPQAATSPTDTPEAHGDATDVNVAPEPAPDQAPNPAEHPIDNQE